MTVLSRLTAWRKVPVFGVSRLATRRFTSGSASGASSTSSSSRLWIGAAAASTLLLGGVFYEQSNLFQRAVAHAKAADLDFTPPERKELPTYKLDEVKKHGRGAERVWVTYKNGVYDITEFVEGHPGGDKILMAAGGSVEPFWALYAQHKTAEVAEILEGLRVGNVDAKDLEAAEKVDVSDPFSTDPKRHPALLVNSQKPFNAESPPELLLDNFLTPNSLFFVRNHLPVPTIDRDQHKLQIDGLGTQKTIELSLEDLKTKYEPVSVNSTIQCAGNRRADMNRDKKVQGLMWEGTAISCAKWTGVRLRDVLLMAGIDPNDKRIKHVHLEGADIDPTGKPYGASIPFDKAMQCEVIIAYSMNDEDIPRDHGYPLRLIAPGIVGARQVKWLRSIHTSDAESPAHWQQKDYRVFPPSVGLGDELKWDKVYSIQEYPIQSAFCIPGRNSKVSRSDGEVDVAGYAWSGGGRGIIRVEISPDGGKTWQVAELTQDPDQDITHMWAWTLWKASVKIPDGVSKLDLVVKATDRAYNTQPETATAIWNVRGLLNNAWHRVTVEVVD